MIGPKISGPAERPRKRTVPYMPIVTPRVDAPERSPNTTPMATNAVAMKGVPIAITIAGTRKPARWPNTIVAADPTITPANTMGHRRRARATKRPAPRRGPAVEQACRPRHNPDWKAGGTGGSLAEA